MPLDLNKLVQNIILMNITKPPKYNFRKTELKHVFKV